MQLLTVTYQAVGPWFKPWPIRVRCVCYFSPSSLPFSFFSHLHTTLESVRVKRELHDHLKSKLRHVLYTDLKFIKNVLKNEKASQSKLSEKFKNNIKNFRKPSGSWFIKTIFSMFWSITPSEEPLDPILLRQLLWDAMNFQKSVDEFQLVHETS